MDYHGEQFAAVFALRMLTRGHLADAIVGTVARSLSISEKEADLIYFKIVTVNMQFILALVIIIFVFCYSTCFWIHIKDILMR